MKANYRLGTFYLSSKDIIKAKTYFLSATKEKDAQVLEISGNYNLFIKNDIVNAINNPVKIGESTNKYTGNHVTLYYIDDVQYVAVDEGNKEGNTNIR